MPDDLWDDAARIATQATLSNVKTDPSTANLTAYWLMRIHGAIDCLDDTLYDQVGSGIGLIIEQLETANEKR